MTPAEVAAKLGQGRERRSGDGWSMPCTAHDDRNPSLSVSEGNNGCTLVNCHAGCETRAVVEACGLTLGDLFSEPLKDDRPVITSAYDYTDENGTLLFQVVKYSPKGFRQRVPDGSGGWVWRLRDVRRVPYRLPQLLAAVESQATVFVVEGEKDADAVAAAGAVATSSSGGAGHFLPEYAQNFIGVSGVIVVADRDVAGYRHARDVARILAPVVGVLLIVTARHGKDMAEHFVAGGTLDDLDELTTAELDVLCADGQATLEIAAEMRQGQPSDILLPEEFWAARPVLGHVRQAAYNRGRSPDVVFHAVLARMAGSISHTIKLPPIVGAPATLSYFVAAVGPPGTGKSSAYAISRELVPADKSVSDLPVGSGEGFVEALFDFVQETGDNGKLVTVKRQTKYNAIICIDEGETLTAIKDRSGNTTLSTLRSIWSGAPLGQANATSERKRSVPPGQYTYGLVIGLQPKLCGPLLDDIVAGTPQRFAWAWTVDPGIPDDQPPWPGVLDWAPPSPPMLDAIKGASTAGYVTHVMEVAQPICHEVRGRDLARMRGEVDVDPHGAHLVLLRLKVAGLLAILEGRLSMSEDDWALAEMVTTTSSAVRRHVQGEVDAAARMTEHLTSARLARRHVDADDAVQEGREKKTAERVVALVVEAPGGLTVATVRRRLSAAQRDVMPGAVAMAVDDGRIIEVLEPGQGDDKRTLRAA